MKCSQIVLSGGYSGYNELHDFIRSIAESERYSNVFMHDLQLSMKEAFVNAVKHGNREQNDLTVCCTFIIEQNSLRVSIRDCGKGFDPDDLPNPVEPGYLLKPSGRGIYIIRNIAEIIGLEHNGDGSSLMLRYIPY